MDLIDNCTRSRGKLNRNSYCSWSHSYSTHSIQWMERIEEEMIYIHSISIVCVENCRLIHGLNDTEVTLVTLSFSLLSKPILDLFQIKWAFHRVHSGWIGSTSHPRSHIVVDHLCSHSKASNRAGNDGRSVHDLDLHGRKGMRNGYEAVLLHPFPIRLFYGSISWVPRNLSILPIATSTSSPTLLQPIPSNWTALVC